MGSSKRDLIWEVEKFLADSAEELPPMKERAKEPIYVKEHVTVRNGVASKSDPGKKLRTNRKPAGVQSRSGGGDTKPARRQKASGDLQTSAEHDAEPGEALPSKGFGARLINSLLCTETTKHQNRSKHSSNRKKKPASKLTPRRQMGPQPAGDAETQSHQGSLIDPKRTKESMDHLKSSGPWEGPPRGVACKEREPSIGQTNEKAGGGTSKSNESASAAAAQPMVVARLREGNHAREAVKERICVKQHYIRSAGVVVQGSFTIDARPFQPPQDPDPPRAPEPAANQAQGDGPRRLNPRNVHLDVNYDNCTENIVHVDHNQHR